ncbi:hypothetical protein RV03_GL001833 [Enterococcus gallinarum]|nr:hypothetical protein RV03_GL001833 [Enterococcus gallinarum]
MKSFFLGMFLRNFLPFFFPILVILRQSSKNEALFSYLNLKR